MTAPTVLRITPFDNFIHRSNVFCNDFEGKPGTSSQRRAVPASTSDGNVRRSGFHQGKSGL